MSVCGTDFTKLCLENFLGSVLSEIIVACATRLRSSWGDIEIRIPDFPGTLP